MLVYAHFSRQPLPLFKWSWNLWVTKKMFSQTSVKMEKMIKTHNELNLNTTFSFRNFIRSSLMSINRSSKKKKIHSKRFDWIRFSWSNKIELRKHLEKRQRYWIKSVESNSSFTQKVDLLGRTFEERKSFHRRSIFNVVGKDSNDFDVGNNSSSFEVRRKIKFCFSFVKIFFDEQRWNSLSNL